MKSDETEKLWGPSIPISKEIHSMKYRAEGESFSEAQARFSHKLSDSSEHFRAIYNIMLDMRFLGGGRTQAAIGSPRVVTAFNCFVSGTIEDSMDSIMDKAKESAQTMRLGGGIGYDFSTLRPRGDNIVSLDSRSSGPISFMDIYDAVCHTISSAGHRRGAQMGVLRIDHPDIEEFIRVKQNETRLKAFNLSVGITDEFMVALKEKATFDLVFEGRIHKTVNAEALWEEIMRGTWDWAEPGVLFIDRINEMNNLYYCETIAATNPCLHPNSMVETTEGRIRIADMDKPMRVYCMDKDTGDLTTSMASPSFLSKKSAKTVRVILDSGKELVCTPDHKFFVQGKGWVKAQNLYGDRIGHLCRTKKSESYSRVKLNINPEEGYIPEHRFVAQEEWGIPDDHDVHHKDENTFDNSRGNLEVLRHDKHSIHTNLGSDKSDMVRDEEGKFISIPRKKTKPNLKMPDELRSNLSNQFSGKVVNVISDFPTDVYDITVENHHNFIANFMVVHNCGEQPLPPYGACLLGSFNLVKYVKKIHVKRLDAEDDIKYEFNFDQLKLDIPHVVRAMDNIHDNTTFPLEEQAKESQEKRRMGLGYTGLANAGEIMGMSYASKEFLEWEDKVGEFIRDEVYDASVELAKEKGSFPLFDAEKFCDGKFIKILPKRIRSRIKKYGIRNSHLLSIAPTGTISLSADNISSGIEPPFLNYYDRRIQTFDGEITQRVEDYAYRVHGIEGKTASQCTAQEHLAVLAIAQKNVDSACSKTINIDPSIEWEDFKQIYMDAYDMQCKGVTTFRPNGKRGGILTAPEESDKEEGNGAKACYIDKSTGRKSCE